MVDLEEKVSQLESWTDGKGLILQGAAGTFCSGSDLNAVRAISNPRVGLNNLRLCVKSWAYGSECSVVSQDGMKMCMFMQNTLTRLLR